MIQTVVAIVSGIVGVGSLMIALYVAKHNTTKDNAEDIDKRIEEEKQRAIENTTINNKLDTVLSTLDEMKRERIELSGVVSEHSIRISRIEESSKSAHHRLDALESRLNIEKEV